MENFTPFATENVDNNLRNLLDFPHRTSDPLRLEGWDENKFAVPSLFARSSLFHVTAKKLPRRIYEREVVYSSPSMLVEYTGEELFQSDLDLLLCLLNISKDSVGTVYEISPRDILQTLGIADCGQSYKILRRNLERLSAACLVITNKAEDCFNSFAMVKLITNLRYCKGGKISFSLEESIQNLFVSNDYSLIDRAKRQRMGQTDMAKMMQILINGTASEEPEYNVTALLELSGIRCESKKFAMSLKKALAKLHETGVIANYSLSKVEWGKVDSKTLTIEKTLVKTSNTDASGNFYLDSLFTLTHQNNPRRQVIKEVLASTPTKKITWTGEELRREEYSCYLALIEAYKRKGKTSLTLRLSAEDLLNATGEKTFDKALKCVDRLMSGRCCLKQHLANQENLHTVSYFALVNDYIIAKNHSNEVEFLLVTLGEEALKRFVVSN